MEILEVETAASVIAALWGTAIDHLATRIPKGGVKRLTSSSSRSMVESAFMIEPLSDSMEEDIFPASRRSAGLTKSNGKRDRDQKERGVNGERVGRTLGVDWGMKRGSNDCHYRRSQGAMRWESQRRHACTIQG